nr:hypothetical protein Itr_chr01CG23430 [Ipomoea trifida]
MKNPQDPAATYVPKHFINSKKQEHQIGKLAPRDKETETDPPRWGPIIAHSIHSCKKEFIYNIAKAFVPTNTNLEIWNLHQHHNEGMDYENQPAAHGVTNFSELENVHCDSQLLGFHP